MVRVVYAHIVPHVAVYWDRIQSGVCKWDLSLLEHFASRQTSCNSSVPARYVCCYKWQMDSNMKLVQALLSYELPQRYP